MFRLLIAVPFLALLVVFLLSNQQPVTLSLWPFGLLLAAPLAIAVLAAVGAGFLLGAVFVWIPALPLRYRARRCERLVRELQAQLALLKEGDSPAATPVATK
jgi:uncharacterized integral membrane protein